MPPSNERADFFDVVGHLGVGQGQGHRVVPGLLVGRAVDGDARRLLEQDLVHVLLRDGAPYRGHLRLARAVRQIELDVLDDEACGIADPDGLRDALCAWAPEALCSDD